MNKNTCLKCEHHEIRKSCDGFTYVACLCKPYDGAWVKNIECPKGNKAMKRTKEERQAHINHMREIQNIMLENLIENDTLEQYREYMICRILEFQTQNLHTRDELLKKSTSELEDIFVNVE